MSKRQRIPVLLTSAALVSASFLTGCEDAASRERAQFQQTLAKSAQEFRTAAGLTIEPDDPEAPKIRATLQSVSRISAPSDAEPGQQAAAGVLASEAFTELARLDVVQIERIELAHRDMRNDARRQADAAVRIAGLAEGHAQVRTDVERAAMQAERQHIEALLGQLAQHVAALEQPISERTTLNERDNERVHQLRSEANELLRRAVDLGHSAGFPSFEDAARMRRDADRIELEIAQREIELGFDLEPERDFADMQIEFLNNAVESLRATVQELERFEQVYGDQASSARLRVQEIRRDIDDALRAISESSTNKLNNLYEQAIGTLERAANTARQAAGRVRGADGQHARLLETQSFSSLGSALWMRARALEDHIALLRQIIDAEDTFSNVEPWRSELRQAEAKYDEVIEQTRNAFEQAKQAVNAVSGGRDAALIEHLKESLQFAVSAASGEEVDWSAASAPPVHAGADTATGAGFSSVDDLIAAIQRAGEGDMSAIQRLLGAIHTTSPQARAMLGSIRELVDAVLGVDRAMAARFQVGLIDMLSNMNAMGGGTGGMGGAGGMGGMGMPGMDMGMNMPDLSDIRIVASEDDRVSLAAGDDDDTLDLVRIGGTWMIDGDSMMEGEDFDSDDLAQMQPMFDGMTQMLRGLSGRINAGEFASPDQVLQTIMGEFMQLMFQGMGEDFPTMPPGEMPEFPQGFPGFPDE